MSDNYYQFLSDMNTPQGIAQDAQVVREHPDGSPCYAKREEDCPIMNQAKKADEADKLEKVATPESMEKIKVGQDPEQDGIVPVSIDDVPTMKETNSKYRRMRNEAYRQILSSGTGDGTYPLDDPSHKVQHRNANGELVDGFADGFSFSFQTTNGEGFNESPERPRMSDDDYDRTTEEIMAATGSKAYVGVFGGIPEISFWVKTKKEAREFAKKYNQVSIANNARIAKGKFENPILTFPPNIDYDWKNNQTFKSSK